MSKENEIEKIKAFSGNAVSISNIIADESKYNKAWHLAKAFADSGAVPDSYSKPSACFVALVMASELAVSPLYYMQHSYPIKGKIGYDAQIMHTLLIQSGVYPEGVEYIMSGEGDARKCICKGTTKSGKVEQEECSIQMAKDNDWYHDRKDKNGSYYSKFKLMPELMLKYRSLAFLIRLHHPEVLQGGYFIDEIQGVDDKPEPKKSKLSEKLASANPEPKQEDPELFGYDFQGLEDKDLDYIIEKLLPKYNGLNIEGAKTLFIFEIKPVEERLADFYVGTFQTIEDFIADQKTIDAEIVEAEPEEKPSDDVFDQLESADNL